MAELWATDASRVDVEPPSHGRSMVLEPRRRAGGRHGAVEPEPGRIEVRHELAGALSERIREPGVRLERRVDLDEPVIDRGALRIEDHLEHAESLVDGLEQRAIALLRGPALIVRELAL